MRECFNVSQELIAALHKLAVAESGYVLNSTDRCLY